MGKKISALPTGDALTGEELAELTQNGVSIRAPISGWPTTSAAINAALTSGTLTNIDAYCPFLHTPVLSAFALNREFPASVVADISVGGFFGVSNTGSEGASVALLAQGTASYPGDGTGSSPRAFGANIVGAASVDQAQVTALEVDIVMGVDAGYNYYPSSGIGVLIASAGYAAPSVALQIHANVATSKFAEGIFFHHRTGFASITGSLIKSDDNDSAVDMGVNFLATEFTTADWLSQNLLVSSGGVSNIVNRLNIRGGATGNGVSLKASGNDTDISILVAAKGSGIISMQSAGGVEQLRIENGTGVDSLGITSGTGGVQIAARGSSTDASVNVTGKGASGVLLIDGAGTTRGRFDTAGNIIAGGTVTANIPALSLTETWNNAGVAFTALQVTVTNTASASTSKLIDLNYDGASRFSVTRGGNGSMLGIMTSLSGTAIGAGANTQAWIKASSTSNLGIYYGTGDPSFSAAKGSLYSKTDATTTTTRLWVNTDGGTTWANFTASA